MPNFSLKTFSPIFEFCSKLCLHAGIRVQWKLSSRRAGMFFCSLPWTSYDSPERHEEYLIRNYYLKTKLDRKEKKKEKERFKMEKVFADLSSWDLYFCLFKVSVYCIFPSVLHKMVTIYLSSFNLQSSRIFFFRFHRHKVHFKQINVHWSIEVINSWIFFK